MVPDLRLTTGEQWKIIEPPLPEPRASPRRRAEVQAESGVLPRHSARAAEGARWKDLPERYPSSGACWRRLRGW